MNAKLEVIRMANDDVIATSGVCAHLNTDRQGNFDHLFITSVSGDAGHGKAYEHGDKLTFTKDYGGHHDVFKTYPEVNTWYYWNGEKYEKCEEQSNAAHPVSPN